ncbi:MAG: undecaprenyl-phosphate glucose phosphotransferase [Anditalea sp.]
MNNSSKLVAGFFLVGDTFILSITLLVSIYFNRENSFQQFDWILFFGLTFLWFLIVYWRKLYISSFYEDYGMRILNFLKSCSILIFLFGLIYFTFTFPPIFRKVILAFSVGFPIAGIITNFIIISIINRVGNRGNNLKHALVAGVGGMAHKINTYYSEHPKLGYRIKGFVECNEEECEVEQDRVIGNMEYMKEYLKENQVDEIFIALPIKNSKKIQNLIDIADYHGTRVKFVPDYQSVLGNAYKNSYQGDINVINVRQMPLDDRKSYLLKECFDWCFSGLILILLSPLFLAIIILIKLESRRPIFYCPVRIGKAGRPFKVYKFCTMNASDSAIEGTKSTQQNDPRITKLGRILRKYSLDELPQFLNVFLGEMSVVGPRPHRSHLNQQFQKSEGNYMIRHYYKPGITGWAQVNGWRGPTDTTEQKHQRTLHDLWYLENWSMKLDMKIIYMTIFGKKTHKSAY